MFRCGHCGSGYSSRAAASWSQCPRCLARENLSVPLTFEFGWRDPKSVPSGDPRPERKPGRAAARAGE
jgi:hypothetical protein